jgi:predicted transcriptional regulator
MTKPRTYTSSTGTTFTDDDVERWAEDAERGVFGGKPGRYATPGRPLSVGDETAEPFSIRLDAPRRAKIEHAASERNTTAAQIVRDLIDAM